MAKSRLSRLAHAAIADLERDLDLMADMLAEGEGAHQLRAVAYAGYRNDKRLRLRGRTLRHAGSLKPGDDALSRFRAMLAIYNSHELADIPVRIEASGAAAEVVSDAEGYFHFDIAIDRALPATTAWEQAVVTLPGHDITLSAPILAPGLDHNWGIISDIDDTVIETGATDFLKNWRRVLIERPSDRLAVPGAASLYTLIARDHRAPARPFFYVSSSPWNLHGFITEFMELNAIPHGPMFLKDYGIDAEQQLHSDHDTHKLAAIEAILAFYPGWRFLLIGDNGQRDVTIYAKVVEDFGARVAGVFIRDIDGSCRSGPEGALLAGIEATGVPTFCGASFEDAVAVAKALDIERPLEAARAIAEPAEATAIPAPASPPPS